MENMQVASCLPYPEPKAECPNDVYACEILSDVGGQVSEMSAVSSYMYDEIILKRYPEVSKVMEDISINEMRHLEIFSKLTLSLGGDPRLWAQVGPEMCYWSPKYIKYAYDVRTIIWNAIEAEKAAIRKYTHQAKTIKDENVVACLDRIILDERIHVDVLTELYNKYC